MINLSNKKIYLLVSIITLAFNSGNLKAMDNVDDADLWHSYESYVQINDENETDIKDINIDVNIKTINEVETKSNVKFYRDHNNYIVNEFMDYINVPMYNGMGYCNIPRSKVIDSDKEKVPIYPVLDCIEKYSKLKKTFYICDPDTDNDRVFISNDNLNFLCYDTSSQTCYFEKQLTKSALESTNSNIVFHFPKASLPKLKEISKENLIKDNDTVPNNIIIYDDKGNISEVDRISYLEIEFLKHNLEGETKTYSGDV